MIDIITVEGKKPPKYYLEHEEVLKENAKNRYRQLSEEEKEAKKE